VDNSSSILTPPAPLAPRINGAAVFGVRPGNPFLYTIPATGDRPMEYSADGLPGGLQLDSKTGRITGTIAKPGEYLATLHARNARGSADRQFKIVVGETIALTPPLGWNSWNCWAGSVDQQKVLRSARAMASSELIQHGWSYINIDDTWQGARDPKTKALLANNKFPDMKGLCDEIHNMGLKVGIYSTPWITSYANYAGGSADNEDGTWTRNGNAGHRIGQFHFANNDATQWAEWGFDYLKYDWNPNRAPETKEMTDALRASGRDIIYSLSNSAPFQNMTDLSKLANAWRTTGDIRDNWANFARIGFMQDQNRAPAGAAPARWADYSGPGHWNDADMLVVGYVGWGPNLHPCNLTPDEQFTHISLWCLLASPLLIGCDLERLDAFTLSLLCNDEVLAVNQDPLGRQARQIAVITPPAPAQPPLTQPGRGTGRGRGQAAPQGQQVWARPLADGSVAVGLFNLDAAVTNCSVPWADIAAKFTDLKMGGKQTVRDLWRQKDLGVFDEKFETPVPAHGVLMVRITPVQ
jgi:alpha-galactosidase